MNNMKFKIKNKEYHIFISDHDLWPWETVKKGIIKKKHWNYIPGNKDIISNDLYSVKFFPFILHRIFIRCETYKK